MPSAISGFSANKVFNVSLLNLAFAILETFSMGN
jgi:hypothetical protein